MGQAKLRGTFEARKQQAVERENLRQAKAREERLAQQRAAEVRIAENRLAREADPQDAVPTPDPSLRSLTRSRRVPIRGIGVLGLAAMLAASSSYR